MFPVDADIQDDIFFAVVTDFQDGGQVAQREVAVDHPSVVRDADEKACKGPVLVTEEHAVPVDDVPERPDERDELFFRDEFERRELRVEADEHPVDVPEGLVEFPALQRADLIAFVERPLQTFFPLLGGVVRGRTAQVVRIVLFGDGEAAGLPEVRVVWQVVGLAGEVFTEVGGLEPVADPEGRVQRPDQFLFPVSARLCLRSVQQRAAHREVFDTFEEAHVGGGVVIIIGQGTASLRRCTGVVHREIRAHRELAGQRVCPVQDGPLRFRVLRARLPRVQVFGQSQEHPVEGRPVGGGGAVEDLDHCAPPLSALSESRTVPASASTTTVSPV